MSCILTNGSRFFMVYLSPRVNADLLSKVYISLRAPLADLQHSLQNVQQKRPSQRYLNFVMMQSLRDSSQCRHSTTFPCCTLNTLPTNLTSSLTNTLPCVKRTFARRTSGHNQEPFKLVNFSFRYNKVFILNTSSCFLYFFLFYACFIVLWMTMSKCLKECL
jgi:hypothetical protein